MFEYPNYLIKIFDKLNKYNIKPIIVGGYVRDKLLKLDSKDIDIELYGLDSLSRLESLLSEFGDINSVGKSFGVCKLKTAQLEIDFSLPRKDSKIGDGHRGFLVEVDTSLNFTQAALRRDFTINAIGYDPQTKKLLDPYHGIKDLKNRLLKAVDVKKFGEDPLRLLRAVQFAARFELNIEKNLLTLSQEMIKQGALEELAQERIFLELQKLLTKASKPSIGLILLQEFGAFKFFDAFEKLSHGEFSKLLHELDSLALSLGSKNKLLLMLSMLCSRFQQETRDSFLQKITNDKKLIKRLNTLVETLQEFSIENVDNYKLYSLANKVKIEELLLLLEAQLLDKKSLKEIHTRAQELGVLKKPMRAFIQGRDLIQEGLKPSKEFSNILEHAYQAQMKAEFLNYDEAKKWLKKELHS